MCRCFNCGSTEVSWQNDYDYQDLGCDGEVIIHKYICKNCEAEIWYFCRFDNDRNKEHQKRMYKDGD